MQIIRRKRGGVMEQENKMGTMPMGKLLISMSTPMMLSMLVQALYNIVDSLYVASYDPNALSAVSLAFSAQNLMIGIATGTAVGVNALLSKALGEKNKPLANKIATHGVFLSFVGFIVVFCAVLLFTDAYFNGMIGFAEKTEHFDPAAVISYGKEYLLICCLCSLPIYMEIIFERLMQSTGRTVYTMYTQGLGAIINIILDPVFIFTFDMGAAGAAIATVIGQAAAAVLAIYLNRKKNTDIHVSFRGFKPDMKIIGRIYAIGVPSMIMVAIGSVMNFTANRIIAGINGIGISIFGVYFKLQSFIFMPVFGMNNGLIPIIAFNYGAKNRRRMFAAVKWGMLIAMAVMCIGIFIMQVFPEQLLMMFEQDRSNPVMLADGIPALRIISLCFPFAAVCIVTISIFQALGKGFLSALVSFARQLVVLLPVAYALSLAKKLSLIWWAWPIAEFASMVACIVCFIWLYRKTIRHIPLDPPETAV